MLRLTTTEPEATAEWSPAGEEIILQTESENGLGLVEVSGRQDAAASWRRITTISNTRGTFERFAAPKYVRVTVKHNTNGNLVRIWDGV